MTAMTDTVAIALITALSTLTAAGLTGVTSAWLTSRQLRHQRALAREERAAHWAARQRDLRREVYEQLLARADAAYRVLDEGWTTAGLPEASRDAGFAARRALDEVQVRVMLEGPEDVAEQAAGLVRGVGAEFKLLRGVLDAHPGAAVSAAELDRAARTGALTARTRSGEAFVAAARRALGSEPPGTPEAA